MNRRIRRNSKKRKSKKGKSMKRKSMRRKSMRRKKIKGGAELEGMELSALKKRAKEAGVEEGKLEEADDAGDIKAAVIELILEEECDIRENLECALETFGKRVGWTFYKARVSLTRKGLLYVKWLETWYDWDSWELNIRENKIEVENPKNERTSHPHTLVVRDRRKPRTMPSHPRLVIAFPDETKKGEWRKKMEEIAPTAFAEWPQQQWLHDLVESGLRKGLLPEQVTEMYHLLQEANTHYAAAETTDDITAAVERYKQLEKLGRHYLALKSAAELKVAKGKGFTTFDQFQESLRGRSSHEKNAVVAAINAVFKADVEAARAATQQLYVNPDREIAAEQLRQSEKGKEILKLVEQGRQITSKYGPLTDPEMVQFIQASELSQSELPQLGTYLTSYLKSKEQEDEEGAGPPEPEPGKDLGMPPAGGAPKPGARAPAPASVPEPAPAPAPAPAGEEARLRKEAAERKEGLQHLAGHGGQAVAQVTQRVLHEGGASGS